MKPMTPAEEHIWTCLSSFHRGHRRGIQTEELAQQLGLRRRFVREVIARLVIDHGKPVGSHTDWGTYVVVDMEDARLADQCLRREALPTLRRRSLGRRAWARELALRAGEAMEQGRLAI